MRWVVKSICSSCLVKTFDFVIWKVSTVTLKNVASAIAHRTELMTSCSTNLSCISFAIESNQKSQLAVLALKDWNFPYSSIQCVARCTIDSLFSTCLHRNDPQCQAYKWHFRCQSSTLKSARTPPAINEWK
jgi:hypothetical protein